MYILHSNDTAFTRFACKCSIIASVVHIVVLYFFPKKKSYYVVDVKPMILKCLQMIIVLNKHLNRVFTEYECEKSVNKIHLEPPLPSVLWCNGTFW